MIENIRNDRLSQSPATLENDRALLKDVDRDTRLKLQKKKKNFYN